MYTPTAVRQQLFEVVAGNPETHYPVSVGKIINNPRPTFNPPVPQVPQGLRQLSAQVKNGSIYLQTRVPQRQYPDFKVDNKPLSKIQDFIFVPGDAIANPASLLEKQVIYIDNSPQ